MENPAFSDVSYSVQQLNTPPESPTKAEPPKSRVVHGHKKTESWSSLNHIVEHSITIPTSPGSHNTIEVPAIRSPGADASQYMNQLSASPSLRERRLSRNSFGAALPIPRSKRQSRLSSVTNADVKHALASTDTRPGMPVMQPTREILVSHVQDVKAEKVRAAKNMAFVFDIDGVLVHGDRLIPEGEKVLSMLNGNNELGIKIPHIFLTNGSGKPELARTEQLAKILKNPVSTEQFIQSHTPMRALAEYYNTVLVVGGEEYRCREVAEQYGFKDIIVPNDIVAWDPSIAPYRVFTDAERASSRPRDFTQVEIEAIMVFSDSRDYATDMQIIMDLLRSKKGRLGTVAEDPVSERIPIYFSQGDMLCPTEHPIPRMSQGAFRIGLEAMYKALTGVDLERVVYGKPELATYKYADEVIASWMDVLHGEERVPQNIYMVGDNPASDIVGGNMYGWNTCLVRTGVFQGGENDEENPANFGVFANVWEAVTTACKKQLGPDFEFEWDDRVNPVLHGQASAIL
ncbi:HAD-like domain-containing protein [Podospora aff. communis PSN243]|uniref:HAD-like domain-containing protein n=1 Tax=Podospora aff. communis PSN243 TaxID=3040156 RepID=A0AAV9H3E5_9PEZI|nr:HAD-like domain-containing protein [Podospora aff. communis PSN243]